MKIENHRLYYDDGKPVEFVQTPNISDYALQPQYLVMHYTAGASVASAVNTLVNPRISASAHLVIGRDGSIVQLADFTQVTWHAGLSSWQDLTSLNKYSIGIELDNAGKLEKSQDGVWHTWYGDIIDNSQVLEAPHKNYPTIPYGWQLYTPEQLLITLEIAELLVNTYKLKDIVGHDDIAPRRKTDPGPAFPMSSFRSRILGRADVEEDEGIYRTTANLNIRNGPGTSYQKLDIAPLPKGVRLQIIDAEGVWKMVQVLDEVKGEMDISGWVHSNYIERI